MALGKPKAEKHSITSLVEQEDAKLPRNGEALLLDV